jgi:hypothetical protein
MIQSDLVDYSAGRESALGDLIKLYLGHVTAIWMRLATHLPAYTKTGDALAVSQLFFPVRSGGKIRDFGARLNSSSQKQLAHPGLRPSVRRPRKKPPGLLHRWAGLHARSVSLPWQGADRHGRRRAAFRSGLIPAFSGPAVFPPCWQPGFSRIH